MVTIDDVCHSLDSNSFLTDDIKKNILELVIVFSEKFPNIDLSNLTDRLKNLEIIKSNKFLNADISLYDFRNNILYFNIDQLNNNYDIKHVLMYELLNIITSTHYQSGFNSDNKFEALNVGYTEILANYLVGNNGQQLLYPDEAIEANLISTIIGPTKLFQAYFSNDAKVLVDSFSNVGVQV